MTSKEIQKLFLDFFKERGHTIVPSSSLISDDPSVLFTTAGMQQFKPYYLGEKSPYGNNVVSIQKCFRTSDIDSVGDESHLTFFEMLGNFSFNDYFKKEAIKYAYEFITKQLKLKIDYISVFGGDPSTNSGQAIPPDKESEKIWKEIDGSIEIKKAGQEDNFWGPTGLEGPCGPTTEIYIDGLEIWNLVFNEYYKDKKGEFTKLKTPGVDTGMGLERLAMVVQNTPTIFGTDLFKDAFKRDFNGRSGRILLDHVRGIIFLIADGVQPSNKGAGYILRRLMRRAIFHVRKMTGEDESGGFKLGLSEIQMLVKSGISFYGSVYHELETHEKIILETFGEEYEKFSKTLAAGINEFYKLSGKNAFSVYQSFGLPREVMKDLCAERGIQFDDLGFEEEFKKHQEISRTASVGMFKSGLVDTNEQTIKLHTATHLLMESLRRVLGNHVMQKGSNINAERLRLDFSHPEKLTPEQIKKIEDMVNQKIKEDLSVEMKEVGLEEAKKQGAIGVFESKYGERVKVYTMGNFSKEICNGPHVKNTSEIGKFKILKEEAVGAGVRRIRATVE